MKRKVKEDEGRERRKIGEENGDEGVMRRRE